MKANAHAASGTLEEPQVQAMFDRIAGFYDRMNTVMTAGLHHTWRRRAADLAGHTSLVAGDLVAALPRVIATATAPGHP